MRTLHSGRHLRKIHFQSVEGLTSNEGSTVVDEHGFDLRHYHRRQHDYPEDREDAELEFSDAVPKLQEGQRHEERDASADKDAGEDVFRGPPQGDGISCTDKAKLVPERRRIYKNVRE